MQLIKKHAKSRKLDFIGIRVTPDTKQALLKLCDSHGLTISAALEQIIDNYVNYSNEIQDRLSKIENTPKS